MNYDVEKFYLIDVPGGDRRYIERKMTAERYAFLKKDKPGTRIYCVTVRIPLGGRTSDEDIFCGEAQSQTEELTE